LYVFCAALYCRVTCLPLPCFSTFFRINEKIFGKKAMENKVSVFIFRITLSETFLILRIIQWDIINLHRYSFRLPIFLLRFWSKFFFTRHIFEKSCNADFNYNPSSGSRLVLKRRTDRQTWQSYSYNESQSSVAVCWQTSTELAWQITIVCTEFWDTPENGQWTCPKHVDYFVK
jgi:hypothetical protein